MCDRCQEFEREEFGIRTKRGLTELVQGILERRSSYDSSSVTTEATKSLCTFGNSWVFIYHQFGKQPIKCRSLNESMMTHKPSRLSTLTKPVA